MLVLRKSFEVFDEILIKDKINYIVCGEPIKIKGWISDFYVIMTNLIENSIYWMNAKDATNKKIQVTVSISEGVLEFIDYQDTGPGIETHLIESQVIFEPEFSTKPSGTGLGLAIAGEAAARNHLEIKAFDSDNGAYFRLQSRRVI